jgi:hypothetical protein
MSTDPLAVSAMLSDPPTDADYDALHAWITASERGRWFLGEFASRNRHANTQTLAAAIGRIEAAIRGEPPPPSVMPPDRDLSDIAGTIDGILTLLAPGAAPGPDAGAAAERIADIAFVLHEREVEASLCDALDAAVREILDARAHNEVAVRRTHEAAESLREVLRRINDLMAVPAVPEGAEQSAVAEDVLTSTAAEFEPNAESAGEDPSDPGMPPRALSDADLQDDENFAAAVAELAASLPSLDDSAAPIADQPEPVNVAAAEPVDDEKQSGLLSGATDAGMAGGEGETAQSDTTSPVQVESESKPEMAVQSLPEVTSNGEISQHNLAVNDELPAEDMPSPQTSNDGSLSPAAASADMLPDGAASAEPIQEAGTPADAAAEPVPEVAPFAVDAHAEFGADSLLAVVDASADAGVNATPPTAEPSAERAAMPVQPAFDGGAQPAGEAAAPLVDADREPPALVESVDSGAQWQAEPENAAADQVRPEPSGDHRTQSSAAMDQQVPVDGSLPSAIGDQDGPPPGAQPSRALLPEPQALLGPEEDPDDLFEPAASALLAPPVADALPPAVAPAPPADFGSSSEHADAAAAAPFPSAIPSAIPSATSDGVLPTPLALPQPRTATAPLRASPSDPLAAVRALSEEEIIALFS